MSQIVYTELEAFPLRWPYLQLEPLDIETVKTWPSDQAFNVDTASSTYTPANIGSPIEIPVYGDVKLVQVIRKAATAQYELWTNLEVYARKVGNPGPLKVEAYTAEQSPTDWVNDEIREPDGSFFNTTTVFNKWRAVTRNIPEPLMIKSVNFLTTSYVAMDFLIRTAQSDGRPSSTTVYGPVSITSSTWSALSPPAELSPGMYSFIGYTSNSTYLVKGTPGATFGSIHSYWYSTNSGATWSQETANAYPAVMLGCSTRAYKPVQKHDEYVVPADVFGTTAAYTSIYHANDSSRFAQKDPVMCIVFSSPTSPDTSNCYMIQRGSHTGAITGPVGANLFDYAREHSIGSDYLYDDVLVRKTYSQYAEVSHVFDKTYYLGPGSYSPKTSITMKASTGTVYALPVVVKSAASVQPAAEKSTASTTYTTIGWDVSGSTPEIISPAVGPVKFLVRGAGAYNQVTYYPRLYYNKNPVTPRDFGFTELYLMKIRADTADTLARINDKTNIYLASSGDAVAIDPNFRAPISKIHVVKGRVTCDLLGVI
ncbi:hypothetical protein HRbin01_00074 [archaeon HR01]|nr:hypothetical protein HRbin01_00074 [archaeon HR01]